MKKQKFIVFENYCFGTNYYNSALQVVPDYAITDNKIPVVDFNTMSILIERNPYLQVKKVEQ
jgi:hypothetical protein